MWFKEGALAQKCSICVWMVVTNVLKVCKGEVALARRPLLKLDHIMVGHVVLVDTRPIEEPTAEFTQACV